jgi:four helix bundle protein
LQIATGSASEVEYQLLLAHELGYLNSTVFTELSKAAVEVKRMLAGLISKVEAARMVSTH